MGQLVTRQHPSQGNSFAKKGIATEEWKQDTTPTARSRVAEIPGLEIVERGIRNRVASTRQQHTGTASSRINTLTNGDDLLPALVAEHLYEEFAAADFLWHVVG